MFSRFWKRLSMRCPRPVPRSHRPPLWLELLEDRMVLSTLLYLGPASPQNIPDSGQGTLRSNIVVNDNFVVGDVNVTLNIDHSYDSDLRVSLLGPDGTTRVTLFDGIGGDQVNFRNTKL